MARLSWIRPGLAAVIAAAWLGAPRPVLPADVGTGFGERFGSLMSARQAGSGGIALEDPWRRGGLVDVNTVLLEPGLRWVGFGYQFGSKSLFRVMTEGFYFGSPRSTRTLETADGGYGGEGGTFSFSEFGGRILGQGMLLERGGWTVAGLARLNLLVQRLEESQRTGQALELGGQGSRSLGEGRILTLWGLAGPLGRGASRSFAYHIVGGGGVLEPMRRGFLGMAGGWAAGTELEWLGEGLMHGGIGGVYWFGNMADPGAVLVLRAGLRSATGSAQALQPRGGLGVIWRGAEGWAVQFDYAVSPIGELGFFHYATVGLRIPERRPREAEVIVLPAAVAVPEAPQPPPELMVEPDAAIYFFPEFHEMARYRFEATAEEALRMNARLADAEGRHLRALPLPRQVEPGVFEAVWDGLLEYGNPAVIDVPYTMVVGIGGRTLYITAIAKKR